MRICLVALVMAACGGAPSSISNTQGPTPAKGEPYALAIVYSAWELWIGNDQLLPADDPTRYPGALLGMEAAFDEADLAHNAPAGSIGTAIVYSERPAIRVPMGPIEYLNGPAFGTQKDYYSTKGTELVRGVTLGIAELEKTKLAKKHLIVLSDGNDTDDEAAKVQLATLKQRAAEHGIDVTAIIYKSALSSDGEVISKLTSHVITTHSADTLSSDLAHVLGHPGG